LRPKLLTKPDATARPTRRSQRILLVSANYRPSVGGIERFVETLAEGLAARGREVVVLCCRHDNAPLVEERNGVRIVRLPASHFLAGRWNVAYPLPWPLPLVRALRRLLPWADVVHVHDALYVTSVATLVASRRRHVPTVLTQHAPFVPQSSRVLDLVEKLAVLTVGRCARLASKVVTYNDAVSQWATSTWGLGEVPVLPTGVAEPDAGGADRLTLRREFSLPEDRFLALFVGRDVPTKRLDLLLHAADPSYEIVAVTDRPTSPSVPPGVRLLPFMPPDCLQRLLLAADAFVLPSKAEGFPLSLQEALLAGLPCVVTRVPGFDRYLGEDDVVWIDGASESIRGALTEFAADPSRRATFAERAKTAGRRAFGLDRFVDAYESLYQMVVAEESGP